MHSSQSKWWQGEVGVSRFLDVCEWVEKSSSLAIFLCWLPLSRLQIGRRKTRQITQNSWVQEIHNWQRIAASSQLQEAAKITSCSLHFSRDATRLHWDATQLKSPFLISFVASLWAFFVCDLPVWCVNVKLKSSFHAYHEAGFTTREDEQLRRNEVWMSNRIIIWIDVLNKHVSVLTSPLQKLFYLQSFPSVIQIIYFISISEYLNVRKFRANEQ